MCVSNVIPEVSLYEYLQLIINFFAPIIGVVGAIWVLRLQYNKEKKRDEKAAAKRLSLLKDYLIHTLKSQLDPAGRQANAFKELVNTLKEPKSVPLVKLESISSFDQQWFFDLDKIELRQAFLEHSKLDYTAKLERWDKLQMHLAFLNKIKQNYEGEYNRITDDMTRLLDYFDQFWAQIRSYSHSVLSKLRTSNNLNKGETLFHKIMHGYYQLGPNTDFIRDSIT